MAQQPDPAVQRRQSALVLMGYLPENTSVNGVPDKAYEAAKTKFLLKENHNGKIDIAQAQLDSRVLDKALDDKMRDPSFRDQMVTAFRADKNLTQGEVTGLQWLLKEGGGNLHKSTRPNGLMDGQMGAETRQAMSDSQTRTNPKEVAEFNKKIFPDSGSYAALLPEKEGESFAKTPKLSADFTPAATGSAPPATSPTPTAPACTPRSHGKPMSCNM